MNISSLKLLVAMPGVHFDPTRLWRWYVYTMTGLLLLVCAWSAWIYLRVVSGVAIDASSVQTTSVVDQSSINTVRSVLQIRAAEEQKYRIGAYSHTDPSQ